MAHEESSSPNHKRSSCTKKRRGKGWSKRKIRGKRGKSKVTCNNDEIELRPVPPLQAVDVNPIEDVIAEEELQEVTQAEQCNESVSKPETPVNANSSVIQQDGSDGGFISARFPDSPPDLKPSSRWKFKAPVGDTTPGKWRCEDAPVPAPAVNSPAKETLAAVLSTAPENQLTQSEDDNTVPLGVLPPTETEDDIAVPIGVLLPTETEDYNAVPFGAQLQKLLDKEIPEPWVVKVADTDAFLLRMPIQRNMAVQICVSVSEENLQIFAHNRLLPEGHALYDLRDCLVTRTSVEDSVNNIRRLFEELQTYMICRGAHTLENLWSKISDGDVESNLFESEEGWGRTLRSQRCAMLVKSSERPFACPGCSTIYARLRKIRSRAASPSFAHKNIPNTTMDSPQRSRKLKSLQQFERQLKRPGDELLMRTYIGKGLKT